MVRRYSEIEGEQIVRAARAAIELFLRSPNLNRQMLVESLKGFGSPNGVFVTIYHYPTMGIRGRMGIHGTGKHMGELVVDAAIGAAFMDPHVVPVSLSESPHMTVEVEIIDDFEDIKSSGKGKLMKMKMGRDGLCISYGVKSALLMPSFPGEHKLNKVGFFEAACRTIGIQKDLWMQAKIKVSRFETQIFAEEEPDGRVREVRRQK
jgi:uncharacterized protein (TIGR00296 family)